MENNLPEGWEISTLQELCTMVYGKGLLTKFLTEEGYPVFGANGIIGKYTKYIYENPQVIISCRGAASGVVHKTVPFSFVTSNSIVLQLNSNEIDLDYFKNSLESVDRSKIVTGSAQPQITIENLNDLEIPIAPLPEQKRIVAKVNAVMQKLESNNQRLENIPKILKRFRQSVLTAAVNGKLTSEWRKKNKMIESAETLYKKIQKAIDKKIHEEAEEAKKKGTRRPKDHRKNKKADFHETELETLPLGWEYYRLEDLTYIVTDGTHHTPVYKEEGVKFLSVKNVRPFKIRDKEIKFISEEEHKAINSRCNPEINDILYTKVGATYGYACVNNLDYPFSIFVSLALIKPVYECINSKFLEAVMNSETVFKQARERISGIGTPDLHLIEIRDFKIPLCSIEEQKEIVRIVEKLFAFADKLETRYTKAKTMIDKLPQSILAKAFRGELVAQDPNDEPASVLLERIKKEKAKLTAEKKGKKSKEYSIEEQPLKIAAEGKVKYKKAKA